MKGSWEALWPCADHGAGQGRRGGRVRRTVPPRGAGCHISAGLQSHTLLLTEFNDRQVPPPRLCFRPPPPTPPPTLVPPPHREVMPVARTASSRNVLQPPPAARPPPHDDEIIIISSDEDEEPVPVRRPTVRKPYARPASRPAAKVRSAPTSKVYEANSAEQGPQQKSSANIMAELQRQLEMLKKVCPTSGLIRLA